MTLTESFIKQHGYPPTSNTTVAQSFCVYCQAESGEIHSLACPEGERYKYFQILGQSGISISGVEAKYEVEFYVDPIHTAASFLGRKGGLSKSESKTLSSRQNGKKGGRPKNETLNVDDI